MVDVFLWVGSELLSQVKEFKCLWVLFTSKGKMERVIDRQIGPAIDLNWNTNAGENSIILSLTTETSCLLVPNRKKKSGDATC